jgi:hypothetical protein
LPQRVNDQMRCVLRAGTQMEHRNTLRERIDGQPEHLCGAAEPGAQFVQLEVWELQGAKEALVQCLSMQGLRATAR